MGLKKTGLYEIHKQLGAKLVEFAGFEMPIQYSSILQEHRRVRETVGLFDVSHMGEFIIRGPNALPFLQALTINDVSALEINQIQYSAMCYKDGGIVDDVLVYRFPDYYMVVVNAANLDKDLEWAQKHLLTDVELVDESDSTSLLALQGPKAEATLQKITDLDLTSIKFYWLAEGKVDGVDMMVSRTGYTGEPGFELCFPRQYSEQIWNALMQAGAEFDIEPAGLGARDTLRLEVNMNLYGNDIDHTTNPLEARMGWVTKLNKGDFIGREALRQIKEQGLSRKLVAFETEGKTFPRHGYDVYKVDEKIGHVTSGSVSPMLNKGIGMAYVDINYATIGEDIDIEIRGRRAKATIVKPPIYKKTA